MLNLIRDSGLQYFSACVTPCHLPLDLPCIAWLSTFCGCSIDVLGHASLCTIYFYIYANPKPLKP